jgi:hypothetical protein
MILDMRRIPAHHVRIVNNPGQATKRDHTPFDS